MKAWLVYEYEKMPTWVKKTHPSDDFGYYFLDGDDKVVVSHETIDRLEVLYWRGESMPGERNIWHPSRNLRKAFKDEDRAHFFMKERNAQGFKTEIIEIEVE